MECPWRISAQKMIDEDQKREEEEKENKDPQDKRLKEPIIDRVKSTKM